MYCLVLLSALLACAAGVPLNSIKQMPDGRIFGGTLTDITDHPYQVSVMGSGIFQCHGNIISANWVVTISSRCASRSNSGPLLVRSGSSNSSSGGTLHSVTRVIIHENNNGFDWDFDVAVMQVSPAFTFSDRVQPITLECDPVPAGTAAVVTGWGPNSGSDLPLERANVQIISDSECRLTYGDSLTDRMICAADPNDAQGGCLDFGGALVANNKLVGMFSWAGCGGIPGVFTKVSFFCDWIVINAGLYKISGVINWIKHISGLQTMPLTFIATYPNN